MTTTAAATLPLTTIFSAPTSCFSTITHRTDHALLLGIDTNCVPSGAQTAQRSYAFSPGLDCPSSYTTAWNTMTIIGTATEGRAICRPVLDGISALSGLALTYNSKTDGNDYYSTLGCTMGFTKHYAFSILSNGISTSLNFNSPAGVNAYSVQIAWQSSDLRSVSATPTPNDLHSVPTSSNLPTTFSSPIVTAMQTSSSLPATSTTPLSSSISDSDLSTGSKVAIGILTPLAALGLVLAIILLVRSRRLTNFWSSPKYLSNQPKRSRHGPGMYVAELNAMEHTKELDTTEHARELDVTKR